MEKTHHECEVFRGINIYHQPSFSPDISHG